MSFDSELGYDPQAFFWQEQAGTVLTTTDRNLVVVVPTGGGKTDAAARAFLQHGRGVLVEPTRALCFEKKRELEARLAPEGLIVRIGNKDYGLSPQSFTKDGAAVCVLSPFKLGQLLTNLGRQFGDHCPVVVFDEAHNFGELEGLITLLRVLCPKVRLVALSATITDEDKARLADWMGAVVVESHVRPVPLVQMVVSFEPSFGDDDRIDTSVRVREVGGQETTHESRGEIEPCDFDHVMWMHRHIVRDASLRAPVLIWTPYRERANQIAELLLAVRQGRRGAQPDPDLEQAVALLPDGGSQVTDVLKRCIPWGVGIHHGGLSQLEAELVHVLAADNRLVALAGCRTVAQGLNLPWRHVVIEDPYDHDAEGERRLIPPSFFHQLSGRAGRPGRDTIGYVWVPTFTEVDRVQVEEILLGTKASPLVSRIGDERFLTVLIPQLVKLRFDTVSQLVEFIRSTYWGGVLQDTTPVFDQLTRIVRYLVEHEVLFPVGDLLVATERGAKLAALGLHPDEFAAIERLTAARSLSYEDWVEGLGRACLGPDLQDVDREGLAAVAEFGLTIYSAIGRGHARARDLADRIQRLMEVAEAYFSHRVENVPYQYRRDWSEQVHERFTLGKLQLARQLKPHLTWSQLKRLIRNLGGLMTGDQPLTREHLAIVAASLYGDEPVFRFGPGAEAVGRVLGLDPEEWLEIIITERGRR